MAYYEDYLRVSGLEQWQRTDVQSTQCTSQKVQFKQTARKSSLIEILLYFVKQQVLLLWAWRIAVNKFAFSVEQQICWEAVHIQQFF